MLTIAMAPGTASAAPGEHILVGDSVITPKIDLGVEYRTNAYQREIDPIPAANIRVAPGFEVSAKGPQTNFQANAQSELRYMLVSSTDRRANLDRFSDFTAGANLQLLTDQVLQFHFSEAAGLKNNITNAGWQNNPFQTQFRNDFNLKAPIRVGPAIEVTPGGQWAFDDFRVPEAGRDSNFRPFNSRNAIGAGLDGKWTFFPRTAAIFEADFTSNLWKNNLVSTGNITDNPYGDTIYLPNSNFLKLSTGIRGRFTQRLVLIVTAGYGLGIYTTAGSVPDNISQIDVKGIDRHTTLVQGRVDLGPGNKVSIGYRKDFEDSWFANYLAYHHIYTRLENRFGPRFGTQAEIGIRFEAYDGQITRQDQMLRIKGDVSYSVQDWLSFAGGVWLNNRMSTDDEIEYLDVNVHLLTNFTY